MSDYKLANMDELIVKHLAYCPNTGVVTWIKPMQRRRRKAGDEAGSLSSLGYRQIQIKGRVFRAHRIAWFLSFGEWPTKMIDHINGIRTDNRLCNLRLVDHRTNCENKRRAQENSRTGVLGVSAKNGRFYARIVVAGKKRFLGVYESISEAQAAYLSAKRELHKGCTL